MSHADGEKPSLNATKNILMLDSVEEAIERIDDVNDNSEEYDGEDGGSEGANDTPPVDTKKQADFETKEQASFYGETPAVESHSVGENQPLEGTKDVPMVDLSGEPNTSSVLALQAMEANYDLEDYDTSSSSDDANQASKRKLSEDFSKFFSKRLKMSHNAIENSDTNSDTDSEFDIVQRANYIDVHSDNEHALVEVDENMLADHFGNEEPVISGPSPPDAPDIHEEVAARNSLMDSFVEILLPNINRFVEENVSIEELDNFINDDDADWI